MARAFPIEKYSGTALEQYDLLNEGEEIPDLSEGFNKNGLSGNRSPFNNCGIMSKNSTGHFIQYQIMMVKLKP